MSPLKIDNSLLTLMLGDGTLEPALKVAAVQLPVGPLSVQPSDTAFYAYFPVDALIAMVPDRSDRSAVALVGRHGGVFDLDGQRAMRAHVMVPGQAYQVDWTLVHKEPTRHARWLWHAAAATQGLIGQMGQWSFCTQHHTPTQRLASWLLYCSAQLSTVPLRLHLDAMPPAMRQCLTPSPVVGRQFVAPPGFSVSEGVLSVSSMNGLLAQACTCHQDIGVRNN